MTIQARARAGSNIALVKYWGKRESALNLPATGSISLTLDSLFTVTTVKLTGNASPDRLILNGEVTDPARVSVLLNHFRTLAQTNTGFDISSENNFPTAAGLASSASAFAALAVAANGVLDLQLSATRLSELARRGSGSAARSIFGGFVEMARGELDDGSDSVASALADAEQWPLNVVVAITSEAAKAVPSTQGMNHTVATSPYFPAWLEQVEVDLGRARQAIAQRDFSALCEVTEASALAMHASAMAAQPGVIYFNPATLSCIEAVRDLREQGADVCFTIDAGPQVKAICLPGDEDRVADRLAAVEGVSRVLRSGLGSGAGLIE
ncbi:MAG: diphosphomevalonate decarboxylase [Pseudomonadota bacterium]